MGEVDAEFARELTDRRARVRLALALAGLSLPDAEAGAGAAGLALGAAAGADAAAAAASSRTRIKDPWETLSPTLIATLLTLPARGEGTSIDALSLSSTTRP